LITRLFLIAALFALPVPLAHGGIVGGVTVNVGTELPVFDIVQFSVTNFDMTGLQITAHFTTGLPEVATFSGTSAVGPRFRLDESGDTFDHEWHLENLSSSARITQLVIEGGTHGNTIFDLQGEGRDNNGAVPFDPGDFDATEGTEGSQRGHTFHSDNVGIFSNLVVTAEYSNIVRLTSASDPVGDVWTTLTINFGGGGLIGGVNSAFRFYADTDTWGQRTLQTVPEPSSLALLTGLAALGACFRSARRRKPFHA
jgi:hypothetical protein